MVVDVPNGDACAHQSGAQGQGIRAARSRVSKPLPIVEGVGGEGVLRLDEQPFGEKACPAPQLRIGAPGVALSIEPSVGWVVQAPPPAGSTSPAPPPPWERTIVPRAASVRRCREREASTWPPASLLRLIAAALPPCPVAMISADPRTPWQEIVTVADATAAAGFSRLRLLNAAEPPADCSDAIPVADLQGRFSTP